MNVFSLIVLCFVFFLHFQKRRSNRQVKRKKYAEELEARLSDDEVKVIVKTKKTNTAASKEPAVQLFVVSSYCMYKILIYSRSQILIHTLKQTTKKQQSLPMFFVAMLNLTIIGTNILIC